MFWSVPEFQCEHTDSLQLPWDVSAAWNVVIRAFTAIYVNWCWIGSKNSHRLTLVNVYVDLVVFTRIAGTS